MAEITQNELEPNLRSLYTKAVEAVKRQNYDYAVTLLNQILAQEPGLFECRQALRHVQARKCAATRPGFFKKILNSAGSSPQIARAKLALHKHPAEAMAIAEAVLNGDPNNPFAHRVIVEAARTLELPRTAAMSLEALVKHSPRDKSLVIEFANTVVELGLHADEAEKYLDELIRVSRYDPDLLQAQKNLAAHKTLDEGSYSELEGDEGPDRDVSQNQVKAISSQQQKHEAKMENQSLRLIGEYETRLAAEPDNLKLMRSLADLCAQENLFDRALNYYQKLKHSDLAGDATLDRAILETRLRHFDFQISQLNPAGSDYAERVERIQSGKLAFQLADCQQRAAKYPTDLAIRFELGRLYFQAGKIGEAIGELQKAQHNLHQRVAALSLLGQCFVRRNMNDLAARTFQNAIKEKSTLDDEKKELIYHLGCVLEKMGKTAEAVEQFQAIYETDINYRDVSAKVDAHYARQQL